ncbi:sugar phosphate nucleotidyltransferase [Paenibacillus hamazuiensis]|uniref:sugar phosphate nucleotidyltransferase n=1 Tax=Paenibacillus hamazuiensis TaxID=2936508 RepID=UPI00200DDD8F|nr:sugar phosphate nucleotidyltransferase [Paenibacillus hamazuiensis]
MKAVIMAGGKGTRLRPLTCHIPKPMVPLLSKPCMEYIIELLRDHGITDIAVTVQYLPDVIRDYFGDGREFGVNLHYFEETAPLGTAGSVKNAEPFLDERFIVISGDALTDFDLTQATRFHEQNGALSTLVLTKVSHPLEYGVVMTGPDGKVIRFLEKPSWGEVFSDTVNTGIYILEPEVLGRMEPGVECDFSNQLFPELLKDGLPMYGYVSSGYWSDIGSLEQYRQTQFDMLDRKVNVRIRGREIRPGIYVGDNVAHAPSVRWHGPAFIGDGSVLGDGVEVGEYCIVGKNNQLRKGSSIHRTILWDHNHIAEHNELRGATLASQITSKEHAEYADGSVVGSHCVVGRKSSIRPGVKVWPKKRIRENSRLTSSLIWGEHSAKSLFKSDGVTGAPNVDITPEFAARFAAAYGATLAPGKALTVSSSHQEFAKTLRRTVAASLQSAGTHVIDLGETLPPVARFGVRQLSAAGGIHIQLDANAGLCTIECYDGAGLPISKAAERKAENSFWQEDYGRAPWDRLGTYHTDDSIAELYLKSVLAETALEEGDASAGRYRLVIAAAPPVFSLLGPLLEHMGCELLYLSGILHKSALSDYVAAHRADLGLWIDASGRHLALVTPEGEPLEGDRLRIVQYLALFHRYPGAAIGLPVSAPQLLESFAEGLGCRTSRTKETARAVMEASPELPFHPAYDALFATALIVQNMRRSGLTVSELLNMIPSFHLQREHVDCPWDAKGQVMRQLMEQAKDAEVDLVDGIKFYHDGGWVLLLPDSDEPVFQVIAHADRPEIAEVLVRRYREQILSHL